MGTFQGGLKTTNMFKVEVASPLDSRLVVNTKEDLIDKDTWPNSGANAVYVYTGMVVSVVNDTTENNGLYMYLGTETLSYKLPNNWKKLDGGSGGGAGLPDGVTIGDNVEINRNVEIGSNVQIGTTDGNVWISGNTHINNRLGTIGTIILDKTKITIGSAIIPNKDLTLLAYLSIEPTIEKPEIFGTVYVYNQNNSIKLDAIGLWGKDDHTSGTLEDQTIPIPYGAVLNSISNVTPDTTEDNVLDSEKDGPFYRVNYSSDIENPILLGSNIGIGPHSADKYGWYSNEILPNNTIGTHFFLKKSLPYLINVTIGVPHTGLYQENGKIMIGSGYEVADTDNRDNFKYYNRNSTSIKFIYTDRIYFGRVSEEPDDINSITIASLSKGITSAPGVIDQTCSYKEIVNANYLVFAYPKKAGDTDENAKYLDKAMINGINMLSGFTYKLMSITTDTGKTLLYNVYISKEPTNKQFEIQFNNINSTITDPTDHKIVENIKPTTPDVGFGLINTDKEEVSDKWQVGGMTGI